MAAILVNNPAGEFVKPASYDIEENRNENDSNERRDVPNIVLNYAVRDSSPNGEAWWIERKLKPDGSPICNFQVQSYNLTAYDYRGSEDQVGKLDKSAFTLVQYESRVPDEKFLVNNPHGDTEYLKQHFWPEAAEVIKRATGGSEVVVFNHLIRAPRVSSGLDSEPLSRHPVQRVHVDQQPETAHDLARQYAPELYKKYNRFQILNLWKPIVNTAYDWPLALIDWSTIDVTNDLLPARGIAHESDIAAYGTRIGASGGFEVGFSRHHRLYYICQQQTNEAWLFKNYDSAARGLNVHAGKYKLDNNDPKLRDVSGTTTHTAFYNYIDAHNHPDVSRKSVEIRALVFYDAKQ